MQTYTIPTYHLAVSGTDSKGVRKEQKFEIIRFGIQKKSTTATPTVVGLAEAQTHVIKQWIPTYTVHSAHSTENGAWQIFGNFLIHDGPDNPMGLRDIYASSGCIEICGGPKATTRDEQLIEIGKSINIKIAYLAASRPTLT